MNRIDQDYYIRHGGDLRRPFYMDAIDYGSAAPRLRVFVSDLWFRGWEAWKAAADIAIDTALMGRNPISIEKGIIIGEATELDPLPTFLFNREVGGDLSILLNAASVRTEDEYDATLLYAEARRRLIGQGALKQTSAEFTKYSPAENGRRHILDDIQAGQEARSLKEKPFDAAKEKAIQGLMRFQMERASKR